MSTSRVAFSVCMSVMRSNSGRFYCNLEWTPISSAYSGDSQASLLTLLFSYTYSHSGGDKGFGVSWLTILHVTYLFQFMTTITIHLWQTLDNAFC